MSWKMCLPLVQMSTSRKIGMEGSAPFGQLRPLLEGASQALNSVRSSKVEPCERTWQIKMQHPHVFRP